jgi:hypothetical protein
MLSLLGLSDSYESDGRVITEILDGRDGSRGLFDHGDSTTELGDVYKQLNAPFGSFGTNTLAASTKALASPDDLTYETIESKIANLTFKRNVLAGTIRSALNDAEFGNDRIDDDQARGWIAEANSLINQAQVLAASS